jgi:hypothetical protein
MLKFLMAIQKTIILPYCFIADPNLHYSVPKAALLRTQGFFTPYQSLAKIYAKAIFGHD